MFLREGMDGGLTKQSVGQINCSHQPSSPAKAGDLVFHCSPWVSREASPYWTGEEAVRDDVRGMKIF
jgi:hypothetical protein